MPEAGRRYREARDREPSRRAVAEAQIDRLLHMAMQHLELHRTEPPRRQRAGVLVVGAALSALLIGAAIWLVLR
jgi:hypothetical protein